MRRYHILTLLAVASIAPAMASAEDDLTSLSYISYLERYATVQPASQDDHLEALINMPLVGGDRLDTAREARVEIQLADGSTVWLDEYSSLSLDTIAFSRDSRSERTVLFLAEGQLMTEIPPDALGEHASRVDAPSASVHLNRGGLYRLSAVSSGGLRVEVLAGLAETSLASGGVQVSAGSAAEIRGAEITTSSLDVQQVDDFALWVEQRRQPPVGESATRVDERYARQASQLDSYGNWVYVDAYNTWAWRPSVAVGWQPYSVGTWYWTSAGWSWLSYEPWGWLPYHYGSWWRHPSHGWLWSWGSYWSPAWVHWVHWPGYVGWCPAGYYNYWWWDHYGYWYGWHNWHSPGYPGHPGHPRPGQPPRGDVQPPRPGGRPLPAVESGRPVGPDRVVLDFNGTANVGRIDPTGWNVVRSEDFASPNLSRLVKPGEVALRDVDVANAVVSSKPLVTEAPSREAPRVAIDRAFQAPDRRLGSDLTAVLARDGSLEPTRALQLVQPTTPSRLASTTAPMPSSRRSPVASGARTAPAPSETTSVDVDRQSRPNIHRSTLATDDAAAPADGRWSGSRPTLSMPPSSRGAVRTSPGTTPDSGRTLVVPPTLRRTTPPATGSTASPGARSVIPPSRRSGGSSSPVAGSRPVIVPNTSPLRPSRQIVPPRSSPGSVTVSPRPSSRSAPSVRAPSSSSGSRSSAPSPSRSSGSSGGARSSSGGSSSHATSRSSGAKR